MALLQEYSSNSWFKKGKNEFAQYNPGLDGKEIYDGFLSALNNCVTRSEIIGDCTNNVGKNYFMQGCIRLQMTDPNYNNALMDKILITLASNPNPDLDNNFNGIKSVKELYSFVCGEDETEGNEGNDDDFDESLERIAAEEDGKSIKVGRYTIYNCFTYDTIEKFVKLAEKDYDTNGVCYVRDLKFFVKDDDKWLNCAKYACVRDDYKTLSKRDLNVEDYPYDDYGLSLIFICVDKNGNLAEACSRWNNGIYPKDLFIARTNKMTKFGADLYADGKYDAIMKKAPEVKQAMNNAVAKIYFKNKQEVEQVILNGELSFDSVFKPFNRIAHDFRQEQEPYFRKWAKNIEDLKKTDKKKALEKISNDTPRFNNMLRQNRFIKGVDEGKVNKIIIETISNYLMKNLL